MDGCGSAHAPPRAAAATALLERLLCSPCGVGDALALAVAVAAWMGGAVGWRLGIAGTGCHSFAPPALALNPWRAAMGLSLRGRANAVRPFKVHSTNETPWPHLHSIPWIVLIRPR